MDRPIRCPHCQTKLLVDEALVGHTVLCEECDRSFPVAPDRPAPAESRRATRQRPRDLPRDDPDDDGEYEFDDDRPVRRKPRTRPGILVPMIFGGSLVAVIALIAVGLVFAFGFVPTGGGGDPAPDGARFRIADARWLPNRGFSIDVDIVGARPPGGYRVVWKSLDGRSSGRSTLTASGSRRTQVIPAPTAPNQSIEIWIESEPPVDGAKHSNTFLLR